MKALVDADLFVYRLSSAYDNKYYRYRGVEYEYIGDIHKLYPDADRGAIEEGKNPEGEENKAAEHFNRKVLAMIKDYQ